MFWNLMVIAILHSVNTGDTAESLKISRATTRFTAPLVQGRLDYFAAIDDLYRKPPRENAFAALLQVFPDDLINQVEREAYANRLGIDFSNSHLHRLQPVPEECLDDLREAARNPWKPIENRDFAHWINDNREALADASATAKLPEFFIPLVIHPVGPIAPAAHVNLVDANPFKAMVLLGEALCANAGQAIRDGGSSVAVSDIESAFRLAHHLARSPFFVGRMCARRIEHTACLAIASLLNRGDMTHENSLDLFNRFKKLKPIAFFGAPNLVIDRIGTIQFLD